MNNARLPNVNRLLLFLISTLYKSNKINAVVHVFLCASRAAVLIPSSLTAVNDDADCATLNLVCISINRGRCVRMRLGLSATDCDDRRK